MDAPKIIWLQRPNRDPENEWCGEVTWCEDKQNDDDTCYIKAGTKTANLANEYIALRQRVAELEERIEQALEALERGPWTLIQKEQYNNAITALRAALEQPTESEPVAKPFDNWLLGDWFKAKTIDDMEAFFLSRLSAIRLAARLHGYAIGLHGSCRRDFDLMAMPWRDGAADKDELAHAIANAACGIERDGPYQWEVKPQGRYAVSIPICWTDHKNPDFEGMLSVGHIDLSVITNPAPAVPSYDAEKWQLVPKEPTEEMEEAMLKANIYPPHQPDGSVSVKAQNRHIYKAMLAAAPKPEDVR